MVVGDQVAALVDEDAGAGDLLPAPGGGADDLEGDDALAALLDRLDNGGATRILSPALTGPEEQQGRQRHQSGAHHRLAHVSIFLSATRPPPVVSHETPVGFPSPPRDGFGFIEGARVRSRGRGAALFTATLTH